MLCDGGLLSQHLPQPLEQSVKVRPSLSCVATVAVALRKGKPPTKQILSANMITRRKPFQIFPPR